MTRDTIHRCPYCQKIYFVIEGEKHCPFCDKETKSFEYYLNLGGN